MKNVVYSISLLQKLNSIVLESNRNVFADLFTVNLLFGVSLAIPFFFLYKSCTFLYYRPKGLKGREKSKKIGHSFSHLMSYR